MSEHVLNEPTLRAMVSEAERDALEADNARLRRQIEMVAPVVSEALKPTGEHRVIDGYCPDCGGQCLRDWLATQPQRPYPCGRCRESMGAFMAPEFWTAEGYQDHVRRVHPEGDKA
jgi:endogenous inhibitor of DNA gyrase (YacG/DUF329 family)